MNQRRVVLPLQQSKRQTNLPSLLLLLSVSLPLAWLSPLPFTEGMAVAQVSVEEREAEANRLYELGEQQYRAQRWRQAVQSFESALEHYRSLDNQQSKAYTLSYLGLLHQSLSKYAQALDYHQQSLDLSRALGDRAGEARTLNNIGNVNQLLGNYPTALDYYQQSLVIKREIGEAQGTSNALRAGEAATLNNIGTVNRLLGNYPTALDYYQQSLVIKREIGDRATEASTLMGIGTVNQLLGNYPTALDYYQQSLVIAREIGDRAGEAATLGNIGNVNQLLGNYPTALNFYQQSVVIAREIGDRAGEAATLGNIGNVNRLLGNYPTALDFLQQSLVIKREIGDRAGEAIALSGIGIVNQSLGNYPTALDFLQQSLVIKREIGDRAGEAIALSGIGIVNRSLGNYPTALDYYQQSLVIKREIGDRAGEAATLGNMGSANQELGNYPSALDSYQQSLVISREIGDRTGEAITLGNIGNVNGLLGNYPSALDYYQQSLMIKHEIGDRAGDAITLVNMGSANQELGNYPTALDYYQQSLVIFREIGDRVGGARTFTGIGNVNQFLGNYPTALDFYQRSLLISQDIGDRAGEANALNNIGVVNQLLANHPIALDYYQHSLVIKRDIGDRAGEANTLGNIGSAYSNLGQYQQAEGVLFKAAAILESIRSSDLAEADRVSLFETQRNTYATLQTVLIAQNQPEKALEVAERGRARILLEQLVTGLNSQSENQLPVDLPKFADIQRIAQQQQATLVEYSLVSIQKQSWLYIWVVQPTGELAFRQVPLDEANSSLANLVAQSRTSIGVRSRGGFELVSANEAEAARSLQTLHQLLIEPIADLLPSDPLKRVIFIPKDELFLVPFVALKDASGDYLIEHHTILTAPSIQMLDLAQQQRQSMDWAGTLQPSDLLLVGNPTMPSIWQSLEESSKQLSNLPGAEAEARAIANFFETQALIGDAATESFVDRAIPTARVVHLATHGLLEYGKPEDSGRLDIPGAIALAPDATNDGLLTSAEIRTLDLNAELVVLSACDTGLGTITGDGVIGLARSLLLAGTPSVIVSLWSVPDAPTADLMVEFYRQWQQEGLDKAQALRQAMLSTMATHPDPKDWAAFTLIGEAD